MSDDTQILRWLDEDANGRPDIETSIQPTAAGEAATDPVNDKSVVNCNQAHDLYELLAGAASARFTVKYPDWVTLAALTAGAAKMAIDSLIANEAADLNVSNSEYLRLKCDEAASATSNTIDHFYQEYNRNAVELYRGLESGVVQWILRDGAMPSTNCWLEH